jgi:hypothetical protein
VRGNKGAGEREVRMWREGREHREKPLLKLGGGE